MFVKLHLHVSAAVCLPRCLCFIVDTITLFVAMYPGSSGELNPMAAMFGGFVGQEVVKALSGKFHPLFQWFYYDSAESLPEDILPAAEYEPLGSRCVGMGRARHSARDNQAGW